MRRRRRMSHAAGLALAAALGVSPLPSLAQSPPPAPNSDSTLLAPSLENAPANPPPFRMPGEAPPPSNNRSLPPGTFTGAQSRIGATPVYGSPSGFGAGDTGFDSSNTPHGKKKETDAGCRSGRPDQATTRHDVRPGAELRAPRALPTAGAEKAATGGDRAEEGGDAAGRQPAAAAR
jgi:hypothetical protein